MKKHLALYKLFLHRNMLQLTIVSIFFLFTTGIATGNMMLCETYIDSTFDPSDAYVKINYLCSNPIFHKFIINIAFTFNMIFLSLFISISTSYFFLIFKNNFKHIPKEFADVGFDKNLSLLSSLPIKENTLLKSIVSYSFALIIVPFLILQARSLIIFVRTFQWVGIDLNTFTIAMTLVLLLVIGVIIKLLNSPKLNVRLNMFIHLFLIISMGIVAFFTEKIANYIFSNFSNFTNVAYIFNNNNPTLLLVVITLFTTLALILKNKYKFPK